MDIHQFNYNKKFDKNITDISSDAVSALMAYDWTGNVRELKNLMERGVLVGKGPELTVKDLGIEGRDYDDVHLHEKSDTGVPLLPDKGIDLTSVLENLERNYLKESLRLAGGNESKAALLVNLNHHTFRYRKKKLHIE